MECRTVATLLVVVRGASEDGAVWASPTRARKVARCWRVGVNMVESSRYGSRRTDVQTGGTW